MKSGMVNDALTLPTEHPVKLPVFEGPLDLLLFLIRKNEIDIYDIPIETVTRQYLDVLQERGSSQLETAGEFFVMAATLMHIKSRMLLPKNELPPEVIAEEDDIDPRWELVQQLIEYRKFKAAAINLRELMNEAQKLLDRQFKLSRESFWMPDGAIVDRSMVPVSNWRPPFKVSGLYGNDVGDNKCPSCKWGGPNVCVTTADGMKCKGLTKEQDPGNGKCPP